MHPQSTLSLSLLLSNLTLLLPVIPLSASAEATIGIIGAGVSGLYTALLLQSLNINYEILEANTRPGGRIYTHYFDHETWQRSRPGEPNYYGYFVRFPHHSPPPSSYPQTTEEIDRA